MQSTINVRANSEQIVIREELEAQDLLMLADGHIGAVVVSNFYNAAYCKVTIEHFKKNIQYYLNPSIGCFGLAYFETTDQQDMIDEYYKHATSNIQKIRRIFSPYLSPIDLLRLTLQEKWASGADLENIDEHKMFVGICRILEPKMAILPHQDKLSRDAPNSLKARSLLAQFAANIYLDVPEDGGELDIWDQELDDKTYDSMAMAGSYGIESHLLPPPHCTIKPKSGDLILINSRRLHAVKAASTQSRTAMGCFIGYYGPNKPLSYWS